MPSDPIEDLAVLRDDIDRLGQGFVRAEQASRIGVTEYDRSGTVTVQLGADGELEKVSVGGGWSRHHGPDGLGDAIREAWQAAYAVRARAWGESYANSREPMRATPAPVFQTGDLVARLDAAQAGGVDLDTVLGELRELVHEVEAAVDTVSGQADAQLAATFRAKSASGHVTATVSGTGDLLAVDFARPWVETAHPTNLGREATEAVRAALDTQRRQSLQALTGVGPVAEVERLSRDPGALLSRLGIR